METGCQHGEVSLESLLSRARFDEKQIARFNMQQSEDAQCSLSMGVSEVRFGVPHHRSLLGVHYKSYDWIWKHPYNPSAYVVELAQPRSALFVLHEDGAKCAIEFDSEDTCQLAIHTFRALNSLHCRESDPHSTYASPPLLSWFATMLFMLLPPLCVSFDVSLPISFSF